MTEEQKIKLKALTSYPEWKIYLDVAEDIIQKEDKISTLPKFKTATALQKHLEVKRKAFDMFLELIDLVNFEEINLYQEEDFRPYKTIDKKKPQ